MLSGNGVVAPRPADPAAQRPHRGDGADDADAAMSGIGHLVSDHDRIDRARMPHRLEPAART